MAVEKATDAGVHRMIQTAAKLAPGVGNSPPPRVGIAAPGSAAAAAPREGGHDGDCRDHTAPHQSQATARLPGHLTVAEKPPPPPPSVPPPTSPPLTFAEAAAGAAAAVGMRRSAVGELKGPLAGEWEVVAERRVSLTKRFGESPVKPSPKRQGGVG